MTDETQAPKRGKKKDQPSGGPQALSPVEAITADFGREDLKEATEKGYSGYVWEEDKTQYTALAVGDHDQTGPEKSSGAYGEEEMKRDHFVRGDKI